MVRRKIRALPRWFVEQFGTSRHGSRIAYCYCRIAVALKPNSVEAQALLTEVLIKLGRFDDALIIWEKAFLLNPEWCIHAQIQYAFFQYGQTQAGLTVLQRFVDVKNDFAREHQLDKLGIRFLREFPTNIGHIALLDSYVKMGILKRRSKNHPVLLTHPLLANPCYLKYWRRYLPDVITDATACELLYPLAEYLEDHTFAVMDASNKQICGNYTSERSIQAQWEAEGRDPLLALTASDRERGENCLRTLGVPSDAWFVSLHVREGLTRIADGRDANIDTYQMAIESIVSRGGWVIRMGNPTMKPLSPMPHVIDYAHCDFRSDWMDVFLWARCSFFIGTQSGPSHVPPTFGIPCVLTNWATISVRWWFSQDICIFKLHWSEHEARYLDFAEIISSALGWAESTDYLASQRIKLVDNTPKEINDVVLEMLDRLQGEPKYSKEDEELQKRFNQLYISNINTANFGIGRDFLRKWEHLL